MKEYSLNAAQTYMAKGPSGTLYIFEKDNIYGAITLADEMWMDQLCLSVNNSVLRRVDAEYVEKMEKPNVKTISQVLPNYVKEEPTPIKYTPSVEEREAEIEIAQSKERLEEISKAAEEVYMFLNPEAFDTVGSAMDAIEEFMASDEVSLTWDERVEAVNKYIANDPRKTLHSKVKELLEPKDTED